MNAMNGMNANRPLRQFSLACAGAALAATTWACGLNEAGLSLDARLWREEAVANDVASGDEGWYRLAVHGDAIDVRLARPECGDEDVPAGTMYVQLPDATILEGTRVNHLFPQGAFHPRVGDAYRLALGRTEVEFHVESSGRGTEYVIRYGGIDHRYVLGRPASATRLHAVADLDGDRLPDFLVEVGGVTFLLLSSHARAGTNFPSAQLWAAG
ncbi:hypothetical protein [Ramlibacter sp.]|uniref:hypothetical protein n=1 Tax=Ramlibacter sp. TaxID=1917967 RepID=UPI003D0ABB5D